ncbi:unnamed protein product, partial [Ilex paraguariensis]
MKETLKSLWLQLIQHLHPASRHNPSISDQDAASKEVLIMQKQVVALPEDIVHSNVAFSVAVAFAVGELDTKNE